MNSGKDKIREVIFLFHLSFSFKFMGFSHFSFLVTARSL